MFPTMEFKCAHCLCEVEKGCVLVLGALGPYIVARICDSAEHDIYAQPGCPMLSDLDAEWLWYIVLYWSAVWV